MWLLWLRSEDLRVFLLPVLSTIVPASPEEDVASSWKLADLGEEEFARRLREALENMSSCNPICNLPAVPVLDPPIEELRQLAEPDMITGLAASVPELADSTVEAPAESIADGELEDGLLERVEGMTASMRSTLSSATERLAAMETKLDVFCGGTA